MIQWQDFVFDSILGPVLEMDKDQKIANGSSVGSQIMDDNQAEMKTQGCVFNQETRQLVSPARMVGYDSLESASNSTEAVDDSQESFCIEEG